MSNENDTESAHEVVSEYRVNKTSQSEVNKKFLVEFKNNLQTEWRKCIKCDALVKAPKPRAQCLYYEKHPVPSTFCVTEFNLKSIHFNSNYDTLYPFLESY